MIIADLGHGRGWLDAPAAASIARIDAALGRPLQITEAGRTRAQQQAHYDRWLAGTGSFAAKPGTSPHEFGNAIDTNQRIALLGAHGWRRPLTFEPWHFVYNANLDPYRYDGTPAGNAPAPGDDMPTEEWFNGHFARIYGYLQVPGAPYGFPQAAVSELQTPVREKLDGIVARTNGANTRLDAVIDMLRALDPEGETDIDAIEARLRASEERTIAATRAAIEEANVALRAELVTHLAGAFGIPADSITAAVNAAFDRVYVRTHSEP